MKIMFKLGLLTFFLFPLASQAGCKIEKQMRECVEKHQGVVISVNNETCKLDCRKSVCSPSDYFKNGEGSFWILCRKKTTKEACQSVVFGENGKKHGSCVWGPNLPSPKPIRKDPAKVFACTSGYNKTMCFHPRFEAMINGSCASGLTKISLKQFNDETSSAEHMKCCTDNYAAGLAADNCKGKNTDPKSMQVFLDLFQEL